MVYADRHTSFWYYSGAALVNEHQENFLPLDRLHVWAAKDITCMEPVSWVAEPATINWQASIEF